MFVQCVNLIDAGIRPKLAHPDFKKRTGAPLNDFLIQGPPEHNIQGLINLLGIESPGLTSSMAIADRVEKILSNT